MSESCCGSPDAGSAVCDLPLTTTARPATALPLCPRCGHPGKPVQVQTVRAMLQVSLRRLVDAPYFFCRTSDCPLVYFTSAAAAGAPAPQVFTVEHVRERVYQKEPNAADVLVCYCFRHKARDLVDLSTDEWRAVVSDIDVGIASGQCACDLRNPQGACCLGNVRALIRRLDLAGDEAVR